MCANFVASDLVPRQRAWDRRDTDGQPSWEARVLDKLMEEFAVEFDLVDGASGEPAYCAFDRTARDWSARGELCRAVARRGRAEFIEDDEPLVVMAIPIASAPDQNFVAVGTFVTSNSVSANELPRAAEMLGLDPVDAAAWIGRQNCWNADSLLRMGQLATEKLAAEQRLETLEKEVQDLSINLSTTYEEISLLYRLTQNLKLSSKDEELGSLALEWLAEVVPAESLAIQLTPSSKTGSLNRDARTEPVMLTFGPCPLNCDELTSTIARFGLRPGHRPLIVNQLTTQVDDWPFPGAREMIVVPLCEGDNCFGWLAAFNHTHGGEFGTVEASLLSSVGAILGIHSGNAELYHQQREFFAGVVRALTSAIDAKDPYTCGHSDRVARVAVRLAEMLGCDRKQLDTIYLSGLLHDVGKIGIDDQVLRKPGKLTEAEYEHIKTHAEIGYKILVDIKQLDDVLPVVLHHHEQWNGKGYPHGLAGDKIPLLARIVAVADSFDAMSSDRPYREGMGDEKLDAILRDGAGKQWDAAVVDAFFRARDEIRQIAQQKVKNLTLDLRDWT
ncbi:MAG: HD-GYP domain-containing protein [Planctomycetia bacterium]|nr:HD-GYP domain-containing protein [Planctomycetia bacterium]